MTNLSGFQPPLILVLIVRFVLFARVGEKFSSMFRSFKQVTLCLCLCVWFCVHGCEFVFVCMFVFVYMFVFVCKFVKVFVRSCLCVWRCNCVWSLKPPSISICFVYGCGCGCVPCNFSVSTLSLSMCVMLFFVCVSSSFSVITYLTSEFHFIVFVSLVLIFFYWIAFHFLFHLSGFHSFFSPLCCPLLLSLTLSLTLSSFSFLSLHPQIFSLSLNLSSNRLIIFSVFLSASFCIGPSLSFSIHA